MSRRMRLNAHQPPNELNRQWTERWHFCEVWFGRSLNGPFRIKASSRLLIISLTVVFEVLPPRILKDLLHKAERTDHLIPMFCDNYRAGSLLANAFRLWSCCLLIKLSMAVLHLTLNVFLIVMYHDLCFFKIATEMRAFPLLPWWVT